jgi:hypothetical protein
MLSEDVSQGTSPQSSSSKRDSLRLDRSLFAAIGKLIFSLIA